MFCMRGSFLIVAIATLVGCHSPMPRPTPIVYDLTPPRTSEEAFECLKMGMSKSEVKAILGEGGHEFYCGNGIILGYRSFHYPKFDIHVTYLHDRLFHKDPMRTTIYPSPKSDPDGW